MVRNSLIRGARESAVGCSVCLKETRWARVRLCKIVNCPKCRNFGGPLRLLSCFKPITRDRNLPRFSPIICKMQIVPDVRQGEHATTTREKKTPRKLHRALLMKRECYKEISHLLPPVLLLVLPRPCLRHVPTFTPGVIYSTTTPNSPPSIPATVTSPEPLPQAPLSVAA